MPLNVKDITKTLEISFWQSLDLQYRKIIYNLFSL